MSAFSCAFRFNRPVTFKSRTTKCSAKFLPPSQRANLIRLFKLPARERLFRREGDIDR